MKTLKEQIIKLLTEKDILKMSEILTQVEGKQDSIRAKISELKRKGIVKSPNYGEYQLSLTKTPSTSETDVKSNKKIGIKDFVIIDEFIRLKKKYGKDNLPQILDRFKQLIE